MKRLKWIIPVFVIILGSCSNQHTNEATDKEENEPKEIQSSKPTGQDQVGFLKIDDVSNSDLSPELQELYTMIVETPNYASGVSVANIMLEANEILNQKMGLDSGAVYEIQLIGAHNILKGNPRKSGINLNRAGRWLLRKFYECQTENYPSLAGQVAELKYLLGEIDTNYPLLGQAQKARDFVDQCFTILYLMEEKDKENT